MSDVSVDDDQAATDEKLFQESLISALAEFAHHLPDYQKIEIMMFIIGRTPGNGGSEMNNYTPAEILYQHMLLKCLLQVGQIFVKQIDEAILIRVHKFFKFQVSFKYRTTNYSSSLPLTFLDPLLRTSLNRDADVRLLVQEILHCLIDRHENRCKLKQPRYFQPFHF